MLGHGALGVWALGQLPQQAADALAPGAILPLYLSLVAGAANGEQQQPPVIIIGRPMPLHYDAIAPGAELRLEVQLLSGRAVIDAISRGAVLPLIRIGIAAGSATGDAVGYDNDLMMLLAA